MEVQFTAVYRKVPEGFIGFVEELPGANTQGRTLEEARGRVIFAVCGGLQLLALHDDVVGGGKMSERDFHDAVLRQGAIPIALIRAVVGAPPRPDA